MTNQVFSPSRRVLLAGLGGVALTSGLRLPASAQGKALAQAGATLALGARPVTATLGAGLPESQIWALETANSGPLRFGKGDLAVTLSNELPAPIVLNWLGIDGAPAASALTGQAPVPPGGRTSFTLPLRQPGTFLVNAQLLGEAAGRPTAARALIVEDSPPVAVDRDEVLLIEEWRQKPDGSAIAPGSDPDGTTVAYTINGQPSLDITARANERLRLRFINGCQRALPLELRGNHDVRVMAIDGAPAEPFAARDGQLVLAPGSRIDAFIDATRAPGTTSQIILHDGTAPRTIARLVMSNDAACSPGAACRQPRRFRSGNLPARLDLQGALRADLPLDPKAQWIAPADFTTTPPAFRVKRGRTVVMTITNPTTAATVFRLHGHHFRLLDRLDDGWKPFWLDTLMVDKGQTQRIAFAAEHTGRWLLEATALNWAAPKLVRCYAVDKPTSLRARRSNPVLLDDAGLDCFAPLAMTDETNLFWLVPIQAHRRDCRSTAGSASGISSAISPGPASCAASPCSHDADARRFERRHALRQHPADDPGQHVARSRRCEPRRRVGRDGGAAIRCMRPPCPRLSAIPPRRRLLLLAGPVRVSIDVDAVPPDPLNSRPNSPVMRGEDNLWIGLLFDRGEKLARHRRRNSSAHRHRGQGCGAPTTRRGPARACAHRRPAPARSRRH